MPLEIRELIIRALVDPSKSSQGESSNSSSSENDENDKDKSWELKKSLLDQFQHMLKKQRER